MTADALVDQLREAWATWDTAALAMGDRERRSKGKDKPGALTLQALAHAKEAAITALDLDATDLHRRVADIRNRHIAGDPDRRGMPIRDAVTTALIELGVIKPAVHPQGAPHPDPTIETTASQLKEAS